MKSKNDSKKSYNASYLLTGFLGVFGLFIYLILIPSTLSKAKKELNPCTSSVDVKKCWDKYESKLGIKDKSEFISETRIKLGTFNLPDSEIVDVKKWLPKPQTNLNLLVVPDLSARIKASETCGTCNNPDQVKNDTILLNHIWDTFKDAVRLKLNAKDRMVLDVTDGGQAGSIFRTIADDFIFDLSTKKESNNAMYFQKQGDKFRKSVDSLYKLAVVNPLGADYWYYFNRNLAHQMKRNTLFDDYRNILIIITDGYLEAKSIEYTGREELRKAICRDNKNGKNLSEIFIEHHLKITPCDVDLSNLEILIIEVNERKEPKIVCDFDILKKYWTDWFKSMKVKNAADTDCFLQRNDALKQTEESIDKFIKK